MRWKFKIKTISKIEFVFSPRYCEKCLQAICFEYVKKNEHAGICPCGGKLWFSKSYAVYNHE